MRGVCSKQGSRGIGVWWRRRRGAAAARVRGQRVSDKNVRKWLSSMPKLGVSWDARFVVTDGRRPARRRKVCAGAKGGAAGANACPPDEGSEQSSQSSLFVPGCGPNRTGATIMFISSRSRGGPPLSSAPPPARPAPLLTWWPGLGPCSGGEGPECRRLGGPGRRQKAGAAPPGAWCLPWRGGPCPPAGRRAGGLGGLRVAGREDGGLSLAAGALAGAQAAVPRVRGSPSRGA